MPNKTTSGGWTTGSIGRRPFLAALGAGAALSVGVGSAAAEDVTRIDSCTTITEPGTYRLTQDLADSFTTELDFGDGLGEVQACIEILTDNVHFDGAGHTLTNPNERELGQLAVPVDPAVPQSNIVVENVTSVGWEAGFAYLNVSSSELRNVTADGNEIGIGAFDASDVTIADATVTDGIGGVSLLQVTDSTVVRLTADTHSLFGLAISRADRNTVCDAMISNTVADEELEPESDPEAQPTEEAEDIELVVAGIDIDDTATDNVVVDSKVTNSSDWDVVVANEAVNNPLTNLELDSATVSINGREFAVRAVDDPPAAPENFGNVGGYIAAADRGEDPLLDLGVQYVDSDVMTVNEETVRLWEFIEPWSELSDSTVDTTANLVSALITDFDPDGRVFGPFGEVK